MDVMSQWSEPALAVTTTSLYGNDTGNQTQTTMQEEEAAHTVVRMATKELLLLTGSGRRRG
jgi:hypothetical protein